MFAINKILYSLKTIKWNRKNKKINNNSKNYIMQDEIKMLDKINECLMHEKSYYEAIHKAIDQKLKTDIDLNVAELICVNIKARVVMNNLNIQSIKTLYGYLETLDWSAKRNYDLVNIFDIVNGGDKIVTLKDIDDYYIDKYYLKINVTYFNELYKHKKENRKASVMNNPLVVLGLCSFGIVVVDKIVDLFIAWKWGA